MSATIQGIIFDFGNVLSTVNSRRFLAGLQKLCGHNAHELERQLFEDPTLMVAFETGRMDSQAFLDAISEICGKSLPVPDLYQTFVDIFEPIEETRALVRAFRGRYRLGLLSNTNPWHFTAEIQTCPVFPLFDAVTLSYEVGAMKPDPKIYQDALAKMALPPEACVFIDDRPDFAEAARHLGIHGITYTHGAALVASLRALGVMGEDWEGSL